MRLYQFHFGRTEFMATVAAVGRKMYYIFSVRKNSIHVEVFIIFFTTDASIRLTRLAALVASGVNNIMLSDGYHGGSVFFMYSFI